MTVAPDRTRDGLFDNDGFTPPESQGLTSIYYGLDGSGGRALDGTPLSHLYLGPNGSQWLSELISNFGSEVANLPLKGVGQVTLPTWMLVELGFLDGEHKTWQQVPSRLLSSSFNGGRRW